MGPNYWLGAWALVTALTVGSGQTDEDEKRPYKFAFSIEGYQHRSEQKDERGIIMGEYGFVTGDGVYHVTVYATDENGNFKIISMKNYYVGLPGEGTTLAPTRAPTTIARTTPAPVTQTTPSTTVSPIIQHLQGLMGCSGCIIPDKGNGKKSPTANTPSTDEGEGIIDIRFDDEERFPASSPTYEEVTQTNLPSGGDRPLAGDRPSGGVGVQSLGGTKYPPTGETKNPTTGTFGTQVGIQSSGGTKFPPTGEAETPTAGTFGTQPTGGLPNVGTGEGVVSTSFPRDLPGTTNIPGTNTPSQGVTGNVPSSGFYGGSSGQQALPGTGGAPTGNRFGGTSSSQEPSGGQAEDGSDLVFPKPDQAGKPVAPSSVGGTPPETSQEGSDLLYKFNYTLKYHGHHESGYRNGDKEGAYFFNGRDGKGRNVEYVANEFGFQPNITLVDLGLESPDTPKEQNEEPNELKGYEFKWFYQR